MSYAKKIGESAALVYGQNIVSMIFGVVSAVTVIGSLGLKEYGLLTLAMSTMGLLLPFVDFSVGQVVTSDIASEIGSGRMDKVKRLWRGFVRAEIFMGVLLSLILYFVSFIWGGAYGPVFPVLVRISSAFLFMYSIRNVMLVTFGGFSQFKALSLIQAGESVFKLFFVLIAVYFLKFGALGAITAYFLATTSSVIFIGLPFLILVMRKFKGVTVSSEPVFKNLIFGHGKFQMISQPISNFFESARSWIITFIAGVEALAVFQVAFQIYSYINMFLGAIEAVMMPTFAEEISRSLEMAKKILVRVAKYTAWLGTCAIIAVWAFVPLLLKLLFATKYDASIPLVLYAVITLPIDGFGLIFRPALFSLKAQKSILKVNLYLLLATVPLASVLTYFYGAWGFILTLPFGSLLGVYLRYRYLVREKPEFAFSPVTVFCWDLYDREFVGRVWRRITGRY